MDRIKSGETARWSPHTILAGVFVLSALPFLLVELFPGQLKIVMNAASYAVFHNITEFFSIMVSLSIFGVGWYTYDQSRDRYALFLSAAFLAIGLLDFMHTLSSAAMPAFFTANSTNKSSQFWIAARFVSASAFLGSAFVYPESEGRWLSKRVLLPPVLSITGLAFLGIIFFPSAVPATFVPGIGVTPFKKISEYLIMILFVLAIAAHWQRMKKTGDRLLIYYLAAFIISIFSEQVFALYTQDFDTYNILGHIYKVAAFFLIYQGIFAASVTAPYVKLLETGKQLEDDIAERRLMEEELRAHRDNLEDLVGQRTKQLETVIKDLESFSSSVSHDLRAPLRAIDAFAHMLGADMKEKLAPEERRKLEVIRDKAKKMNQLIDALLALAHLGSRELSKALIDVEVIARDVWSELETLNPDRDIAMHILPLPPGYGDDKLIRQVFANLAANAVKFTRVRPKAHIEVSGYENPRECVYSVKDNGTGFAMENCDRLFGLFQRLHSAEEYEGTGVGLSTVKRIIERHGGRVWAEGKAGEGAIFYFTLPRKEIVSY